MVLYRRERSPGPEDITTAVLASQAQMPRKSSFSAPGGMAQDCHMYPPSSVRRMVPLAPLAHATPLPTAWMPRRPALVVEFWNSQGVVAIFWLGCSARSAVTRQTRLTNRRYPVRLGEVRVAID